MTYLLWLTLKFVVAAVLLVAAPIAVLWIVGKLSK